MWHKASAPGSLMLMGEYAVLQDSYAIVAALDQYVTVTLSPRNDKKIFISSSIGEYTGDLSNLEIKPPFQFVLTAIKQFSNKIQTGFELEIKSDFLPTIGLGSSAAVTTAMVSVLSEWLQEKMTKMQIIQTTRSIIQAVQGLGSGADVAASVVGGVTLYGRDPLIAESLTESIPLTVIYSGHKTPTVEAVQYVKNKFSKDEKNFYKICDEIKKIVSSSVNHVKNHHWSELGENMNIQQRYMDALGVNTPALTKIINVLQQQPGIFGAKISGSGLGDCAIGLGVVSGNLWFDDRDIQVLSVNASARGVVCEKG